MVHAFVSQHAVADYRRRDLVGWSGPKPNQCPKNRFVAFIRKACGSITLLSLSEGLGKRFLQARLPPYRTVFRYESVWIRLAENDPTLSRLRIEYAAMGPAAARALAAALASNTHLTDLALENTGAQGDDAKLVRRTRGIAGLY